jgi:hypothetical protein
VTFKATEYTPAVMPAWAKRAGEIHAQVTWSEPLEGTPRLLTALEQRVNEGDRRRSQTLVADQWLKSCNAAYVLVSQSSRRLNHQLESRVREIRQHGSVKQETHLVTPPRSTAQEPIIGFAALLRVVEWYHVRRQKGQQGGPSCVNPEPSLSPPAPDQSSPSPRSAPSLARPDRRITSANPGHPQSHRSPAARSISSNPGGDQ